jgi:hypothetical protein
MADDEVGLANRMPSSLVGILERIPPLEMYLPVDEHRSWAGGRDLIVVGALTEDHVDAAYDLEGRPAIVSHKAPPDVPALVLVPAETDFSQAATEQLTLSPVQSSSGSGSVYIVESSLNDLHEPWYLGDPEIALHYLDVITGQYIHCTSALTTPSFDQNNQLWTGSVDILSEALLTNKVLQIQVWEDDYQQCDNNAQFQRIHVAPDPDAAVESALQVLGATGTLTATICAFGGGNPACLLASILAFPLGINQFAQGAYNNDDLVGVMRVPPITCLLMGTSPARFNLMSESGATYGSKWIELTASGFGTQCPLEVAIYGDTYACTSGSPVGHSFSNVANGSGTISYEWYEDSVVRGTAANYTLQNHAAGTRHVALKVTSGTEVAWDSRWIPVYEPDGELCWEQ